MIATKVTIFEHEADVPELPEDSFFHSRQLMRLCEQTPRHKALMAVATAEDGTVEGHLLCIVRYRLSWFPPYFFTHARIYDILPCEPQVLGRLMEAITERLQNRVLYIEVSSQREKMYGYRELRRLRFFPVRWMNVHNSLHSRTPEERITQKQMRRVENAMKRGATTKLVETNEEFKQFSRLLRRHNWLKPRRYLPDDSFFRGLRDKGYCRLFITKVKEKVVGCSVCVYSGNDAYLWFSASRRKSFAPFHPNAVTFWNTIKDAHERGCEHIRFMDVGLPFRKNPYRDFILSFGGKEVSTYRWFRISIRWANRLASWLWRE